MKGFKGAERIWNVKITLGLSYVLGQPFSSCKSTIVLKCKQRGTKGYKEVERGVHSEYTLRQVQHGHLEAKTATAHQQLLSILGQTFIKLNWWWQSLIENNQVASVQVSSCGHVWSSNGGIWNGTRSAYNERTWVYIHLCITAVHVYSWLLCARLRFSQD